MFPQTPHSQAPKQDLVAGFPSVAAPRLGLVAQSSPDPYFRRDITSVVHPLSVALQFSRFTIQNDITSVVHPRPPANSKPETIAPKLSSQ